MVKRKVKDTKTKKKITRKITKTKEKKVIRKKEKKVAPKKVKTQKVKVKSIKKEDILLSDDEYIKILIKEKGLNLIAKGDLTKILEMRKTDIPNIKKMSKPELIKNIKNLFK